MSASENSGRNPVLRTGPYAVPDRPGPTRVDDPDVDGAYEPAVLAGLRPLPGASPETAPGSGPRAVVRAHRAAAAGAAAGTAAALALAYGWGRRTGRLAARRDLGPMALFFGRRG